MKAIIPLVCILGFLIPKLNSQEYFIKTDSLMAWANYAQGVERIGDTYIVGGIAVNDEGRRSMFFATYDSSGQRIHHLTRPEIDYILSFDFNNQMLVEGDRILWSSIGTGRTIFYNYNVSDNILTSDTIQTIFSDTTENFALHNFMIVDDGKLLAGRYTEDFTDSDFGLYYIKSDTVTKLRITEPNLSTYGSRIFQLSDSLFAISAEYEDCALCGDLRVYIVDRDLNVINTFTSTSDILRTRTMDAVMDSLGNIVSCSLQSIRDLNGGWLREPLLTKINIHDGSEWDAKIGYVENEYLLGSGWHSILEATDDDGYVVAGSNRINNDSLDFSYATLAKVSIDGDSVWYRRFSTIDTTHAYHVFRDVTTTPDGGYFAVGYENNQYFFSENNTFAKVLLVKTDKDGLVEADSTSNVVTIDEKLSINIVSYPNPVIDNLFIQHSTSKLLNYTLVDSAGNIIEDFKAGPSPETFILDVSHYPGGMYYLTFLEEKTGFRGYKAVIIK